MTKISDKYVLQKFFKEYERVLAFVYTPPAEDASEETNTVSQKKITESQTATLNYLRFKELLIEMCFMTEHQATSDSAENTLAFELWELIAPPVNRDMPDTS